MNFASRMIVVGEEPVFLSSVAGFLTERGIACDSFDDSVKANTALKSFPFTLLIADVKKESVFQIDFLKSASGLQKGMSILLVVSSPDVDFAAELFELPVMGCLVKPIDFDRLLEHVYTAIRNYQTLEVFRDSQNRLRSLAEQFSEMEALLKASPRVTSYMSTEMFFTLAFQNILGSMMDVKHMAESFGNPDIEPEACHMMNCPQLWKLTNAVRDTLNVLEQTRHAFKSKELGLLRRKLELVMQIEPEEKKQLK
jgi:DNA-binding response OmpR family regulator